MRGVSVRLDYFRWRHGRLRVFDPINVSAPNRNLRELECPRSVVQNYIEQRFANPDTAVVLNKAELAEAVHEEADAGSGGADHSRQSFLRDLWNYRFMFSWLTEFRHQQENSS
jgi:hypothetical protein